MPRRRKVDPTYKEYDPNWHPQDLITRMSQGQFNCEIFSAWHISEATFYRWRNEHPELEEAYQQGLPACEAWWINNKFKPMVDGKLEGRHSFNATMALANAKFKYRHNETQQGNSTTNNITVNVLSQKTQHELEEKIRENLKFLSQNNIIEVDYKVLNSPDESESNQ